MRRYSPSGHCEHGVVPAPPRRELAEPPSRSRFGLSRGWRWSEPNEHPAPYVLQSGRKNWLGALAENPERFIDYTTVRLFSQLALLISFSRSATAPRRGNLLTRLQDGLLFGGVNVRVRLKVRRDTSCFLVWWIPRLGRTSCPRHPAGTR